MSKTLPLIVIMFVGGFVFYEIPGRLIFFLESRKNNLSFMALVKENIKKGLVMMGYIPS